MTRFRSISLMPRWRERVRCPVVRQGEDRDGWRRVPSAQGRAGAAGWGRLAQDTLKLLSSDLAHRDALT